MTFEVRPLPPGNLEESKVILKKLASAHRALAELKGVATAIPIQKSIF